MGVGCEVIVGESSLSIHLLCNGEKTQKLWKPLLTQFSLSEASRNGLHNGMGQDSFWTHLATKSPYFLVKLHKTTGVSFD